VSRPVIPARPTTYKGIKMRSRLEADYASALDRDGETWEYEPQCFGGPDGQWLPDFRVGLEGSLVEIKPAYLLEWDTKEIFGVYDRVDKILQRMTVAWLSEPDAILNLIFWAYGKEQVEAPLSIEGSKRHPAWLAYVPSMLDVPLVWPGMNQLGTLLTAPNKEWPS
jgi:hypothetical protein